MNTHTAKVRTRTGPRLGPALLIAVAACALLAMAQPAQAADKASADPLAEMMDQPLAVPKDTKLGIASSHVLAQPQERQLQLQRQDSVRKMLDQKKMRAPVRFKGSEGEK